ncbi:uncharacterized protein Nmlp_2312 [Natronomonas moolapensis 8.8.11]|uniref:Uncharacterized protein n=1 Tax=Natronomonas moolapensis (strain DSM 18674 / CECT 7526 / JCM 14361 / 8.8.11) TaxID=268739 RepID=M1XQN1_NATM8|nr:hypothetical protein [Natronomonas moolapensis]CCQ36480.1 uncharacterized protein Nmlp_2312 [Natronomonas moolapensis 8.8.11]
MGLDDLAGDVETAYAELGGELAVELDAETRNELAMLESAYDPDDADELLRRAVHVLFQDAVETGNLDFHLRSGYDVTYDEYLSGMTYDEMAGGAGAGAGAGSGDVFGGDDNARRYQF